MIDCVHCFTTNFVARIVMEKQGRECSHSGKDLKKVKKPMKRDRKFAKEEDIKLAIYF